MGWWWHLTGAHGRLGWFFSTTGRFYAVASGIGIGFGMRLANRGICHENGCYRPALRSTVEASGEHVHRCRKHHKERHQ